MRRKTWSRLRRRPRATAVQVYTNKILLIAVTARAALTLQAWKTFKVYFALLHHGRDFWLLERKHGSSGPTQPASDAGTQFSNLFLVVVCIYIYMPNHVCLEHPKNLTYGHA